MASRPINLVLDWDGTTTTKDTMFAMGIIANERDKRTGKQPAGPEVWEYFGKAYMDDFMAHQESYVPKAEHRTHQDLESAWLRSLETVEAQSVARVEASGFLRGVKREDVLKASSITVRREEVALRHGWHQLFATAQAYSEAKIGRSQRLYVSILSVNWSEAFIRAALVEAAHRSFGIDQTVALKPLLEHMDIVTNEICDLDSSGGSSGHLSDSVRPSIRTSFDKHQHLKIDQGSLNVYVGDSTTDFDCLLAADIGICIRDEPMGSSQRALAETLARVGCKVIHVNELNEARSSDTDKPVLLWAKDFEEILRLLLRTEC